MLQISISLPERLVAEVDRLTKIEKCSCSSFIIYILENLQDVAEKEATYLKAAESKPKFDS